MSSRLFWIAVFTLAVRLATSSLYLASSLSSSVTLALTMAMLSFMRGTWSFMSRIFCWRIISGSSATEMKKPTKDRTTLLNRCHIKSSYSGTLRFRWGRRHTHSARRNGILTDKISDRFGDLLFFLLFLQPPAGEALFLPRNGFVVALDFRSLLGHILINLSLNLAVFFIFSRFQFVGRALLHALVGVKGAVAPNRVLDDVLNVHASSVERDQDRRLLHVRRQIANVLALQHLRDLEDRIALRCGRNFRRLIDILERSGIGDGSGKLRL